MKISLLALFALAAAPFAHGQYPTKPITMVVPYAARGPTDTVARVMGIAMAKPLGQTVVFENKPSAGGILAPELDKGTPAALQAHLKAEIDKWASLIKKAGVYAD